MEAETLIAITIGVLLLLPWVLNRNVARREPYFTPSRPVQPVRVNYRCRVHQPTDEGE